MAVKYSGGCGSRDGDVRVVMVVVVLVVVFGTFTKAVMVVW